MPPFGTARSGPTATSPSIETLQIASGLPERMHQIDVEFGGAEDFPNGILPDMQCDP
jgi:hypothetical protein